MTPSPDVPERALNTLLRGVAHDTSEDIRQGWQRLRTLGRVAIPAVCQKLTDRDWSEFHGRTQARYLTILLMILAELDVTRCEQEIARLFGSKLHDLHARTVALIRDRLSDQVYTFELHGISVRIHGQLQKPELIRKRLSDWIRIPPTADLAALEKIDIVPAHPDFDYLGFHSYRYSGIVITWLPEGRTGLMQRLELFNTQSTFYHEIGHSVLGHSEPGQVPEQEDEANAYQRKMLRRAYPVMTFCLRLLMYPMRFILGFMVSRSR